MMLKKILVALLLLVVVGVSFGCAGGMEDSTHSVLTSEGDKGPGAPRVTFTQPAATTTTPNISYSGSGQSYAPEYQVETQRMIIYTGNMNLVVEDVAGTMQQITDLAASNGGYVVNSNSWTDNERMMASISIRVEADRFNSTLTALKDMAVEVRSETTNGQDVTEEYIDLEAQLTTLEASESQLLNLMEQAGTVEEILEVQKELTRTRTEIERVQGRMQYLEQSAALSFISVQLEQSKLTVELNASRRTVKEGEDISFNPVVAGGFSPYTYEWDFGDGETSTEPYPNHKYNDDGVYSVTLLVTDDRGNTESYTREDYITVNPGWSAGSIASSAWNGLAAFGRVLLNILIWLGIFSPVWIIILLIIFLLRRKRSSQRTS